MTENLASLLDFANHHASATPEEIKELCRHVTEYGFNSAFVNPVYVPLAHALLAGKAKVGTVIAFPLGQEAIATKIAAARAAVEAGTNELDIVPHLALLLSGNASDFLAELKEITGAVRSLGKATIIKFILDPGYFDSLADSATLFKKGALLIGEAGADFVKIGSGLGPRGPNVNDVKLVREAVGPNVKIKVAGGIDTYAEAKSFIEAGANRIGTSHAIEIIKQIPTPTPTDHGSAE